MWAADGSHTQLSDSHWQTRGYLTQAAALNLSTHAERMRLTRMLRIMAKDKRIAVRVIALEALGTVAVAEPKLREEVVPLLNAPAGMGYAQFVFAPAAFCPQCWKRQRKFGTDRRTRKRI